MKHTALYIGLLTLMMSCQSKHPNASKVRIEDEAAAIKYLDKASEYISAEKFDLAQAQIDSLRKKHAFAIDARRKSILVCDSLEILRAKAMLRDADELSLSEAEREDWKRREMFYEKKLAHDSCKTP